VVEVKVLNVYNNEALPGQDFRSGHGESFLITAGNREILLDTGWKGNILMQNIRALGIDVNAIDKIVFSHGHRDHTGGLPSFLEARTDTTPLPVIAHPDALEPKWLKKLIFYFSLGLPKLRQDLARKVEFQLARDPEEVLPRLSTTGEIPIVERIEKPGIAGNAFHKLDGKCVWDPVIDDLSLVLQTKDGLVMITGCCHAGLLNACARTTKLFGGPIRAIIGGTHMLAYSRDDIEHVGDELEKVYGTPQLYLNHCTGKQAIEQLRIRFGSDVVHDCLVGTELTFEI
jgi:7,8-dihydropterin-6-yl-methyl-4-(beta-D-ribofuranosyl)aminobenzene 5'-phosphate synthase